MVTNLRQRSSLQFQYFWDFNKCLPKIFSQLSFGNFWLHLLGEADMIKKLLKMTENPLIHHAPERVHELAV